MLGKHLNICEDSHTASVFSHLLHLPAETFWHLLLNACYTKRLPHDPGVLRSVHPWPRWSAGLPGKTTVVPDLFIRFAAFDLIIEAKRGDDDQQSPDQWRHEVAAYANEFGAENHQVKLIALGGLFSEADDAITHQWTDPDGGPVREIVCDVHMCRWRRLLYQCQRMQRELVGLEYPNSQTAASLRVLTDLVDLFARHGYSTGRWFADVEFARYRLSASIDPTLRLFANRSRQLVPR